MSQDQTPVTPALQRYIVDHAPSEDPFLRALVDAAASAGIPAIAIHPVQAAFIQVLLRWGGAREVVEVGTLFGYGAISMARALPPEGRVRTIELDPSHAAFAESWIARSDVAGRVQVCRGAARDVLRTFADASADAAFIDADKEGYEDYLEACLRIVRPGGLIMADNAFAFGELLDPRSKDPGVAAIRLFNETMSRRDGLAGVIAPFGDGLWVAVRT